jgi:hypothetical protein
MTTHIPERRRVQRVRLLEPLRGTIGAARIFVLDVSLRGFRVAHQDPIGDLGDPCPLHSEWEGRRIDVTCSIVRTQVHRAADARSSKTLYHSGLEIQQISATSSMALRSIIETHIARAIDEQRANARGIPAIAAQSFQTGNARHFVRHELVLGRWREVATTDSSQPENGFTVAADHTPHEVQMLRNAYSSSRELVRSMARLSVSGEGVPTRRYMP